MKKCTHKEFKQTVEGSGVYKCINCRLLISLNDTIDILNKEHESVKGNYELITVLRRKNVRS